MSEDTRVYELGYLLTPQTPEASLEEKVAALSAVLSDGGGEILSTGAPEYIDLAYPMHIKARTEYTTYTQAYFGFIKFTHSPEVLEQIKKSLDSDTDLIRYILVKTSAENAVVFKKPKLEPKRGLLEELEVTEEEMQEEEDVVVAPHEALPELDITTEEEAQ